MGRKKVGLINIDNCDSFIDYIKARTKKLTDDRVSELVERINSDRKKYHHLSFEFATQYGVFTHEPDTLTAEHIKLIAEINETAFHDSNNLIDNINGLKTAFKNAQSQARYKKKNRLTDNERFILEFNQDEYLYLKMMKELCKENDIKLEDELHALYRNINKRCNKAVVNGFVAAL
ncbi:hypothetical protein, partial [Moritella viscosa]|uniref:hypothetical protein n=1 Tax=Moritella viscosa TaxID=80854 RepID=UPI000921D854